MRPSRAIPLALLLAVVVRLPFSIEALRTPVDGDTAIVGLMARHPGVGTTFWGQPYGSPLDWWVALPFVAVWGYSTEALRLPVFLLGLLLVPLAYALARHLLHERGTAVEILSTFHPELASFAEWCKQLAGESEGKAGRGLFPASAVMTTDLHSLGQYLQEGSRGLLETFLVAAAPPGPPGAGRDRTGRGSSGRRAGAARPGGGSTAEGTRRAAPPAAPPGERICNNFF